MNKGGGFEDANGNTVSVGSFVEYNAKPGRVFYVEDVTQDGDVTIVGANDKRYHTKWRNVCKVINRKRLAK